LTFLLDTNVVSEPSKMTPHPRVMAWLAAQRSDQLFVSAGTVAEVRYGVEAAPAGARRAALETWYAETFARRPQRIVAIEFDVAEAWGRLRRRAELQRRAMSTMDALIAASAEVHGLILVTRNVKDFEIWGGPVFNPWTNA
jgi:predicted nucleic acid-binding protein